MALPNIELRNPVFVSSSGSPMSELSADVIARIAGDIVRTQALPVTIVGAIPTSSGSRYVEIVVRANDCAGEDACCMQIGVLRSNDGETLRLEIAERLHHSLANRRRVRDVPVKP
jgi:hypothetical protein